MSIDFENMDVTDHGHIPYVVILVRVLEDWKKKVSICFVTFFSSINPHHPSPSKKARRSSSIYICRKTRVQEDHWQDEEEIR